MQHAYEHDASSPLVAFALACPAHPLLQKALDEMTRRQTAIRLVPYHDSEEEQAEYLRQRLLCGWAFDKDRIAATRKACADGNKVRVYINLI